MKKRKTILSLILSVVMLGSFLPMTSFAAGGDNVMLSSSAADAPESIRGNAFALLVDKAASPWAGSGTERDPYLITNESELTALSQNVNNGNNYSGKYFALKNNITLQNSWIPIGDGNYSDGRCFSGIFDGNNNVIEKLSLSSDYEGQYAGLFGWIDNATVKNLTVEGELKPNSNTNYVGGIIGCASGKGQGSVISNCVNRVNITSGVENNLVLSGGILGTAYDYASNKVDKCINYGNISGTGIVGGIVGTFGSSLSKYQSTLSGCLNYGKIFSTEGAAGIAGMIKIATVSECANKAEIVADDSSAGTFGSAAAGIVVLVNANDSTITDCYNIGAISASSSGTKADSEAYVGGIFSGVIGSYKGLRLINCYNTGKINKGGNFQSTERTYGEIAPSKILTGNTYDGVYAVDVEDDQYKLINCYTREEVIKLGSGAAEKLSDAFVTDENGVNPDKTPLLKNIESTELDTNEYSIRFMVSGPSDYSITLFSNNEMEDIEKANPDGSFSLVNGSYPYIVSANDYITVRGVLEVRSADQTVVVEMKKAAKVFFKVSPEEAKFLLKAKTGSSVEPDGKDENGYSFYYLEVGSTYTYTATASGYNSITRDLTVNGDQTIEVTLTKSAQGQVSEDRIIHPDNVPYTISEGGNYDLTAGDFDTEYVYIDTTEPVTIIGSGTAAESMSENLHIVGRTAGVDLTLQDVYISNNYGQSNLIDFQGKGNTLNFIGMNLLDQDTGATGYAMIHVPDTAELTVTGGTLYMYKREQGAGIGGNGGASGGEGQIAETNGTIHIKNATIFAKNSKQGALIGAGAQAGSQKPGNIDIENSTLYLIAISRGAAIGGSAGSNGASSGSNVSIKDSQLTINVDYSGAAIGGGGYAEGNDSDGGILVYNGGSIRTFIDANAAQENLWTGVTQPGINGNLAITADIVNKEGMPLYLLELDTTTIAGDSFSVKEGGQVIYSGGLHQYAYINEALHKDQQIPVNNTIDNWVPLDDSNLYLYMTGEDHTLDVNGQIVKATWNEETKSFTVKMEGTADPPEAADKSLLEEALKAAQDAQKDVRISEDGSDVASTDQWVPQSAVDTLKAAIETAQKVADNKDSTQLKVDQAVTTLNNAVKAFEEARKPGTKSHDASCPSKAFSDLDTSKWYHEAIDYVLLKNYFNGVGNGKFEPAGTMTRAMFVTVLGRAAGVEEDKNAHSSFGDVADGKWYTTYVDWAAQNDIINGYDSKTFGPDDFISREQMAVILYRYAKYCKVDTSGADTAKFNEFKDKDTVSDWAVDAMTWAAGCGLINGMGDGTLAPQETATRAQVAQIIRNYDQKV